MRTNIKYFLTLCCVVTCSACSTREHAEKPSPKEAKQGWNYEQVRKARSAEQAQDALQPTSSGPETTLDCVMMTEVQKTQARAVACKKLDARMGHGENMYCCER